MARFTCTVAIPHVDTPALLRCCVDNIRAKWHPDVSLEILVIDQSDDAANKAAAHEIEDGKYNVRVIDAPRIDAGYPLDIAVREAKGEYFCSLDCDAWPITPAWLAVPLEQIKRYGFSFVGCDCDLHAAYPHLGPGPIINNFFRVSRTDVARMASEEVGFMRPQNRGKAQIHFGNEFPHGGWHDNGVAANWWVEQKYPGKKLGIPVTRHLGNAHDRDDCCVYGIVVGELVFHLGYGFHQDTVGDAEKQLGRKFLDLHESFKHQTDLVAYADELNRWATKYKFIGW